MTFSKKKKKKKKKTAMCGRSQADGEICEEKILQMKVEIHMRKVPDAWTQLKYEIIYIYM
jgi:hypothetical protein